MAYFDSRRGSFGQPGFDVIFAESLLSLASIDRDPAFDSAVRGTLRVVRRSEPKDKDDLLTYSSEATLQTLATLPMADRGHLYFATPSSPRR